MTTVPISLGARSYDVHIGAGLLAGCGAFFAGYKKALIVTDSNVQAHGYARRVQAALDIPSEVFAFLAGEQSKTLHTYEQILNACAAFKITESDCLVAVGGGVVGDLTGFAAATWRRGVPFVQAPTTLLAMVDSSVGGKTGVNLDVGKNLAGAFWQPSLVLADTDALQTLPSAEIANGRAECLKYGVLWDETLFAALEAGQPATEEQVARCVGLKRDVVVCDEHDTGARRKLNLGHTLGHAIEQVSHYKIPHGAAVGIGMAMMAKAFCPAIDDRLCAALAANRLPAQCKYATRELFFAMAQDKKRVGQNITIVVPQAIGQCELRTLLFNEFERLLEECL